MGRPLWGIGLVLADTVEESGEENDGLGYRSYRCSVPWFPLSLARRSPSPEVAAGSEPPVFLKPFGFFLETLDPFFQIVGFSRFF